MLREISLNLDIGENIFFSIIEKFKNDNSTYLKYYTASRLIREYSFHSFYEKVLSFTKYLQEDKQLSKYDKVVVSLGNSDFTLITYSAIMLLGAVIVPVDPSLNDDELKYIIKNSQSKHIIDSKFDANFFDSLVHDPNYQPNKVSLEDEALIVYTSGTTSASKGVVLTYKNLLSNASSVIKHHKIEVSSTNMCVLPLFHVNAFNLSYFASLCSKSKLILNKNFYLPNFWDIIENEKVNMVSIVPKIVTILLQDTRIFNKNLADLNYFISAAAPLSKESAKQFYERYGIRVLQGYGMSEAVNFSTTMPINLSEKEYVDLLEEELLSIGVALTENAVYVLDENDRQLGENEIGEIAIIGENVMKSYYNNEQATDQTLKNGYLHTGDRGFYKLKGNKKFYYLVGRMKELIIKNGENIAPVELDNKLKPLQGLEQCVTVGFENKYTGEEIGLYVVRNDATPSSEDILKISQELLGKKAPKVVVFGDKIPTTATGKIQRLKLTQFFSQFKDIYYQ